MPDTLRAPPQRRWRASDTEASMTLVRNKINASVSPKGSLETLSQREVQQLRETGSGSIYALFRQCALAILNTGSHSDNAKTILEAYPDFEVLIHQQDRGIRLELRNAPADAFVDGEMIASTREMLFSALRDIVYTQSELENQRIDFDSGQGITDYVFHLLRNARTLRAGAEPRMVVCWGGHSISTEEYKYTKKVGHELGLRRLDICTGCGPGVMKGPMKGATIAHAKQRIGGARYLGLTEPGIIAAEAPNPIVNELVILPDIEKRLEAFVRVGHGIIIFPGGVGTAEEFLYLLGILTHPDNADLPFPVILTGPRSAEPYLQQLHDFIGATLGRAAQQRYRMIINDPAEVARQMAAGIKEWTLEKAAAECDVPAAQIKEVAELLAANMPNVSIHPGRHVSWYGNDFQRQRALACLTGVLGAFGVKGGFGERKSFAPRGDRPEGGDRPARRFEGSDRPRSADRRRAPSA